MLTASIFSHIALGALLSVIFVIYYVHGDSEWKLGLEILLGAGGNVGGIFILDKWLHSDKPVIRMYSVGSCIASFVVCTILFLIIFSFMIKDKDDKNIIRLRDIMLGQVSWIKKYYERRGREIDNRNLNLPQLIKREKNIEDRENKVKQEEKYIQEEKEKLQNLTKGKLHFCLPEHANIVLNKEYIDAMPSYIGDIIRCIKDITFCTNMILEKDRNQLDITVIKSYFISIATYISSDLFGGATEDVRIHFRIYDIEKKGYVKLVAVIGKNVVNRDMTFIPYDEDNMINRSYKCRRALIKSINIDHDYKSDNSTIWEDYLTYTFYGLTYKGIPFLSLGISIKNAVRYKKILHLLNYFRIENFWESNIEQIDEYIKLKDIFYGGL